MNNYESYIVVSPVLFSNTVHLFFFPSSKKKSQDFTHCVLDFSHSASFNQTQDFGPQLTP